MKNKITLFDRIKAKFSKDEYSYWFSLYSDWEKQLRRMNVKELAQAIRDAEVKQDTKTKIICEHLLNIRLAKLQTRPVWWSIIIGFLGIIAGILLTHSLQHPEDKINCQCERTHSTQIEQQMNKPIPQSITPIIKGSKPKINGVQNTSQ